MARCALTYPLLCGGLFACNAVYGVGDSPAVDARTVDSRAIDPPGVDAHAPQLVQAVTVDMPPTASLDAMLSLTTTGDLLVLFGGTNATSLKSVVGRGAWTPLTRTYANANLELWFAIADGSSGPIEITRADGPQPNGEMWMTVTEWAGVSPTGHLEAAAGCQAGSGCDVNTIDPGTVTPTSAALVLYGFTTGTGATANNLPGAWTRLGEVAGAAVQQRTFYEIVDGGHTAVEQKDGLSNGEWDAAIAAFPLASTQ